MYECDICKAKFNDHISLSNHIFSAHGGNGRMLAVLVAIALALALLVSPVKADSTEPPSVGEPPTMLHLVYLPLVATGQTVE